MGLKGYRLWVMGQLDSTCRAPPGTKNAPPMVRQSRTANRVGTSHHVIVVRQNTVQLMTAGMLHVRNQSDTRE
jgi:hypothetical protein